MAKPRNLIPAPTFWNGRRATDLVANHCDRLADRVKESIKVHRFLKKVDRDKSKTIDVNELMIALEGTGITRENLTEFISLYDINGDGELDKRELKHLLRSVAHSVKESLHMTN
nr:visinin 1 [Hymenolepis microstoma]